MQEVNDRSSIKINNCFMVKFINLVTNRKDWNFYVVASVCSA